MNLLDVRLRGEKGDEGRVSLPYFRICEDRLIWKIAEVEEDFVLHIKFASWLTSKSSPRTSSDMAELGSAKY